MNKMTRYRIGHVCFDINMITEHGVTCTFFLIGTMACVNREWFLLFHYVQIVYYLSQCTY